MKSPANDRCFRVRIGLWALVFALMATQSAVQAQTSSGTPGFNAMDGSMSELLITVGNHGVIAHFSKASGWRTIVSGTLRDLYDVHIVAPDFAVASGAGIVLQWDGRQWTTLFSEESRRIYDRVWASGDRRLVIFGGDRRVCPWIFGSDQQPFCRRFEAPMAGACEDGDDLMIILSNGDIYEVNNALMSKDGGFSPTYTSEADLDFSSAVPVGQDCRPQDEQPAMMALEKDLGLMILNKGAWLTIDRAPTGFNQGPAARTAMLTLLEVPR